MIKLHQLKFSTSSVHNESVANDDESLSEDVCSFLKDDVSESAMSQVRSNSDNVDHKNESEDEIENDWENDENEDDENENDENENEVKSMSTRAPPQPHFIHDENTFIDTSMHRVTVEKSKSKKLKMKQSMQLSSTQTKHFVQRNTLNDEDIIETHNFKIWHLFALY